MNILCLDPSLNALGFAVISQQDKLLDYGVKQTQKYPGLQVESDRLRLSEIAEHLKSLILKYKISHAVIEIPLGSKSATALRALSMVRGLIIGIFISYNIQWKEVSAAKAKETLTGDPDATKTDVFNEVEKRIPDAWKLKRHPKYVREAVSDALAVLLTTRV